MAEKRQYLKEAWETYRTQVINPAADDVQIQETRMAFYAGAGAFFTAVVNSNEEEKVRSDEERQQFLIDLADEISSFVETVDQAAREAEAAEG
jgi:hypothetical protein